MTYEATQAATFHKGLSPDEVSNCDEIADLFARINYRGFLAELSGKLTAFSQHDPRDVLPLLKTEADRIDAFLKGGRA